LIYEELKRRGPQGIGGDELWQLWPEYAYDSKTAQIMRLKAGGHKIRFKFEGYTKSGAKKWRYILD
jgi:hypothetical protein